MKYGSKWGRNGHMAVPVYRLAQEPILPSVSLALYQCILGISGMGTGIPCDILVAHGVAYGHFGYINMVKLHGAHYLISHPPVIQIYCAIYSFKA